MIDKFIPPQQLLVLHDLIAESEEAQFFIDKVKELTDLINSMPVTYDTEEVDDPKASLHYFNSTMDFYIVEKDCEDVQLQAFGYANIGHGYEAGYISLPELFEIGVEIDLYFTPEAINTLIK